MPSATLIYNPTSGRQDQEDWLQEVLSRWRRSGFRVEAYRTGTGGEATTLAREAVAGDSEFVVAWGGDGTVNEVANGLVGSEVPLGILPGGWMNILARELGIPLDLTAALELLLSSGKRRRLGVGRAGSRHFLLMAGIGLDAFLVRKVPPDLKRTLGWSSYLFGALRYAWSYPFPPVFVHFDGKTLMARQVVISNVSRYGGSFRLAPLAEPSRGSLALSLFQGRRVSDYVRYLWGIRTGHHSVYRDVLHFQWNSFLVQGGGEPVGVQVDGEYLGETSLEIEKVPDALTLICPVR